MLTCYPHTGFKHNWHRSRSSHRANGIGIVCNQAGREGANHSMLRRMTAFDTNNLAVEVAAINKVVLGISSSFNF
eukprot:scaffold69340_cov16-Tisochrysis_lutea.AAC.1